MVYAFLAWLDLVAFLCPAAHSQSLASAEAAMTAGRYETAAREYEAWFKTNPQSKDAMLALGICYLQLGRIDDAVVMLRRHLKLAPQSAAGHAALGISLFDGAKTTEAKKELELALRLKANQSDAAEALARIYLLEGTPEAAIPLLQSLSGEEAILLLGDALARAGRAREAAEKLEQRLPSTPRLYAATAWAYRKAGNAAKVAEICEAGMRLYPDSEIEAVYLSLPAPFLAERIGARIQKLQTAPDAAELIALGRVLIDADTAGKTRANEIGQRMLAHAIQLAPDNASAHYNYGRSLLQLQPAEALKAWQTALTLNPGPDLRLQILTKVAAAKLDLSEFDAADAAFRAALAVNRTLPKQNPDSAIEYVRFLQLRSRPEEAETLLRETLRWNPLSRPAHLELAKLLAARAQWAQVVEEGEFVLRNAGEDLELQRGARLLLARAYARLNQPQKARPHQAWLESH